MINKVLILSRHHSILLDKIRLAGFEPLIFFNKKLEDLESNIANEIIGIVTSNSYFIFQKEIDLFPNLKFIGRLGSGMEIIDTNYCSNKNIICWSSPLGNANAVAEHALGMLISINNHIRKSHLELQQNQFLRNENICFELNNLKVGIIGLGSNGTLFAQKLLALGCNVKAYDIDINRKKAIDHLHFEFVTSIDELYSCNTISLHIPLTDVTHHFINHEFIQKMHNEFILINCARGSLMDTKAVYDNLKSGKIIGAGIDVWEYEPLSLYPESYKSALEYILQHPNVIATAHIAGYSHDAFYKMSEIIGNKIQEFVKN